MGRAFRGRSNWFVVRYTRAVRWIGSLPENGRRPHNECGSSSDRDRRRSRAVSTGLRRTRSGRPHHAVRFRANVLALQQRPSASSAAAAAAPVRRRGASKARRVPAQTAVKGRAAVRADPTVSRPVVSVVVFAQDVHGPTLHGARPAEDGTKGETDEPRAKAQPGRAGPETRVFVGDRNGVGPSRRVKARVPGRDRFEKRRPPTGEESDTDRRTRTEDLAAFS